MTWTLVKQFGQPVEIALVGEAVALDQVVAPFDAALAPPAQRRDPLVAAADADPADIVDPEPAPVGEAPGEMMRNDAECGILHFRHRSDRAKRRRTDRCRDRSPTRRPGSLFEHVELPGRRTGEVIFDQAAGRPGRRDFRIGGFEIRKPHAARDSADRARSGPGSRRRSDKAPKAGARRVPLQRMIEGEPARQVVVIEIGAVDALRHDAVSVSPRNARSRANCVANASQWRHSYRSGRERAMRSIPQLLEILT